MARNELTQKERWLVANKQTVCSPCLFCGSNEIEYARSYVVTLKKWEVSCALCGYHGKKCLSLGGAIRWWNKNYVRKN